MWILQNCWDDTGIWIDTAFWNDICVPGLVTVGGRSTGQTGWRENHHKKHPPQLPPRQYVQVHPIPLKEAAAHLASAGGNARAASLSSTRRTQIATHAANTRWK